MTEVCVVNTVCGKPRGKASWLYSQNASGAPIFKEIGDKIGSRWEFPCCDPCRIEISRRAAGVAETEAALG